MRLLLPPGLACSANCLTEALPAWYRFLGSGMRALDEYRDGLGFGYSFS